MVDDRGEDDIFELTEAMASSPPEALDSDASVSINRRRQGEMGAKTVGDSVITTPIRNLSTVPPPPMKELKDSESLKAVADQDSPETGDDIDNAPTTEHYQRSLFEDEGDSDVFELNSGLIVVPPVEEAAKAPASDAKVVPPVEEAAKASASDVKVVPPVEEAVKAPASDAKAVPPVEEAAKAPASDAKALSPVVPPVEEAAKAPASDAIVLSPFEEAAKTPEADPSITKPMPSLQSHSDLDENKESAEELPPLFSEGTEEITEEIEFEAVEEMVADSVSVAVGEEISDLEIDVSEVEEIPRTPSRPGAPPPVVSKDKAGQARPPRMRRRGQKKEWWSEIFDDDYLTVLPQLTARDERKEIDFIEKKIAIPQGSLVLDLACGNGRHSVGMAQRGYRLVGVDLSLAMLARAGEVAQEASQKINFIHGDMRELGFNQTFDAVYCVGTSFGYFDENTNAKVLDGISRALKPGGKLLLEVANRDFAITNQPNLTWFEGNGSICLEETEFNFITSRLEVKRQLIMADNRQIKHDCSVRLYSLHELGTMLHNAGFAVVQVSGHSATPNAFFGAESAQLIVVSTRRR